MAGFSPGRIVPITVPSGRIRAHMLSDPLARTVIKKNEALLPRPAGTFGAVDVNSIYRNDFKLQLTTVKIS